MSCWRQSAAFYVVLFIFFTTFSIVFPVDRTNEFLNDLKLTHFDNWGVNSSCPSDLFITAVKVKKIVSEGNTSVNAIQVTCSDEISPRTTTSRSTWGRPSGDWELVKKCKSGFVVGISFLLQPAQDSSPGLSIHNLHIYCSDEPSSQRDHAEFGELQNSGVEVTKRQTQFCETGDAIVGISIKVDDIITVKKGDTAVVNEISIQCRVVTSPSKTHDINYNWEKRRGMRCNDTGIFPKLSNLSPNNSKTSFINCSYESWTGIGLNPTNLRRAEHARSVYTSMGLNNNNVFVKLAFIRRLMQMDSRKWFLQRFSDQPRLLDDFAAQMLTYPTKNYTGSFSYKIKSNPIPYNLFNKMRADSNSTLALKHDPVFEQFVGNCAMYQIALPLFRAKHHVFFETLVKKRMSRIVFNEFDMLKISLDK